MRILTTEKDSVLSHTTFSGIFIEDLEAGEGITALDVCYIETDELAYQLDTSLTTKINLITVMALETLTTGQSGRFLLKGTIEDSGWSYTAGNDLLVPSGAGEAEEAPTPTAKPIGKVLAATKVLFDSGGYLSLAGGTITGDLTLQGSFIENVVIVTDTYQILATDSTVICNKTTAFTVTLPTAVVGKKITIKNINTGLVTLEGSGADTIDGELNQTINQWDAIKVQCYAANSWIII